MPTNPNNPVASCRRLFISRTGRRPDIPGSVELDVTELNNGWIRKREEGLKIPDVSHHPVGGKSTEVGSPGTVLRQTRGHVVHRETVSVLISVLMDRGRQMTSASAPGG
ncbi:MAG: hypothetical protein IPJ06_19935 [Saprospiraceae bacterium]|nr:hypothetical protein [Saprospiraceae bacterium]